jgi:hypothetical protein
MRRILLHIPFLFMICSFQIIEAQSFHLFQRNKEPKTCEEMAAKLSAGKGTDSLKVLGIYKWITENISYDYSAYMSGQPIRYQSPELVYARRRTTCTGYSNIMVAMLESVGIPAMEVEGFTHDFTLGLDTTKLSAEHAWVAFRADGNWFAADPTWDAGVTGIFANFSTTEIKKSFWKRLFSFRFKHLSKKYRQSKTIKKTKVSYRYGFIHNPGLDYIFQDPNEFLKTHLPNTAQFQMKQSPVSVREFCDSIHSLGDERFSDHYGRFNYNWLNDQYYSLEKADKYLWISDSSLNFHYLNHGDKAINAHNYLAYYYRERTKAPHLLEKYISITDTVILHAAIATKMNRSEHLRKKTEFNKAFQKEKTANSQELISLQHMRSHVSRTQEILRRGKERILQKELPYLSKLDQRGQQYKRNSDSWLRPYTSHSMTDSLLTVLDALYDSVLIQQKLEFDKVTSYREKFNQLMDTVLLVQQKQFKALYQGEFINEREVNSIDTELIRASENLKNFVRDSINTILGSRKSYLALLKLDREFKKQQLVFGELQKVDSCFQIETYKAYAGNLLSNAAQLELMLIEDRMLKMEGLKTFIRYELPAQTQMLSKESKNVSDIRALRQGYLYKMMNNKYNRSILVYKAISTNAVNWKKMYKSRLKEFEKNVL